MPGGRRGATVTRSIVAPGPARTAAWRTASAPSRVRPVRQRIRSNGGVRVEDGSLAVALMTRTYGVAQRL